MSWFECFAAIAGIAILFGIAAAFFAVAFAIIREGL
jgi:hypothetical protein